MSSNNFGNIFKITTWGESHGKAIGVVIDGCPAGLAISEEEICEALAKRSPGRSLYTSPRREKDQAEIWSGVFEGKTTGAPISLLIFNQDADSSSYEASKNILRPGHANFTYLEKYGVYDYRGGGRASARETASRVAAGAVAKKLLAHYDIFTLAYLESVGSVRMRADNLSFVEVERALQDSLIFCPDSLVEKKMLTSLKEAMDEGDSLGGIVRFLTTPLPVGLGDPMYEKLEANLAKAMLSIHASKAFEVGEGFGAAIMKGSEHNDLYTASEKKIHLASNHAGGTLGGISNGMPLEGRVVFKPTSSIKKSQMSVDDKKNTAELKLSIDARHDPCVAIRAVAVVEAMLTLVLADALLMNRCIRL